LWILDAVHIRHTLAQYHAHEAAIRFLPREDDVLADTLRRVLREEMAEYAVKPKGRRKTRGLN